MLDLVSQKNENPSYRRYKRSGMHFLLGSALILAGFALMLFFPGPVSTLLAICGLIYLGVLRMSQNMKRPKKRKHIQAMATRLLARKIRMCSII